MKEQGGSRSTGPLGIKQAFHSFAPQLLSREPPVTEEDAGFVAKRFEGAALVRCSAAARAMVHDSGTAGAGLTRKRPPVFVDSRAAPGAQSDHVDIWWLSVRKPPRALSNAVADSNRPRLSPCVPFLVGDRPKRTPAMPFHPPAPLLATLICPCPAFAGSTACFVSMQLTNCVEAAD